MKLILPPGVSSSKFDRAMRAFAGIVGDEFVLVSDEDRETYLDVYSPGNEASHAPAAAVAPKDVEQVQAVLRVANEHRIPLWPISRGKNMGYGGAAPRMPGTVVLDLGRMNRIIEVNEKYGYCILEPGVGFMDLYDYLEERGIALELATPGNGWGSVVGNAMDRGSSGAGEHAANICGMEVVLPDGGLMRTGTGAMSGSKTWPLYMNGFGPSWDQMFVQSNYGIVTQMGLWMKPSPEAYIDVRLQLPRPEDLGWWTDAVTPLRVGGVLDGYVSVTSYQAAATTRTQRKEWYTGRDAIPDEVVGQIMQRYNVGWFNGGLRLAGYPEVNEANLKIVRQVFARHTSQELEVTRSAREDRRRSRPGVGALQIVNWHGGRGGHISFSPVMPPDSRLVLEQLERTRARYREFGIDYSSTFYHFGRHLKNINLMLYDRDDADLTDRTRRLFSALIKDAAAAGYSEYRTHLCFMDEVADTFDFNRHALRRFNERVKDAIDPNGILAPGKSGIWPSAYRKNRGVV